MTNQNSAVVFALLLFLFGCGASQRQKEKEEEKQGLAEVKRIQVAVHGLSILVQAGIAQVEYSKRVGDVLLTVGDLDQSMKATLPKFHNSGQRNAIEAAYSHLSNSIAAYNAAKNFFGDIHKEDLDPFVSHNLFGQSEYESLYRQFLNLEQVPIGIDYHGTSGLGKFYWKGDMLQALWKFAFAEEEIAKTLIDVLDQQAKEL